MGDALHQVAVAHNGVGMMVHDGKAGPVELGSQHLFGQGKAYTVGKTLPQRASGGLDARRVAIFRVSGRLAAPLAKLLELLHRQIVAGQVQQAIKQCGTMPRRQDKPIAVRPKRVGGIVLQELGPKYVGSVSHAHRQAGVA